jgi:hypothetical protein
VVGAPAKGDLDEGAAYVLQVPRNEPPVAHAQELTLPEDTSLGLTLTGTHPKGGTLAFTLVQSPVHGTLSGHPPELVYTPNPNFFGSDSLTFTVNDGVLDSAPAVVTLRVSPINDPPTLTGIADLTLPADSGPTTIPFSVADIDDDAASLVVGAVASEPALFPEGSVVVAGTGAQRTVTLQPAAGASGSAVILLAVADAFETATTQFTVTVVPPPRQNQPPVAVARATPDPVISINGRDGLVHLNGGKSEDPDGDELSYRWFVDDQAAPVLESAAGVVTLPLGMHTVRLEVSDGQSQSVASLRVQVISVTQAVQKLAGEVRRAELSRGRRTALLAILSGASRSFDRQHNDAGVRQLRLFQMMVNAREGHPIDRETAARLTRLAQRIIDAVNGR